MEPLKLSSPHWEALNPETRNAFNLLPRLAFLQQFYLAGGTGLALHLGHRLSYDLNLFSEQKDAVDAEQRSMLRSVFDDPSLTITYDKDSTFSATWQGVGVSFFRHELYPLVRPLWNAAGVPLASIEEIGAMKLAAIIDRGTRKDLIDLYAILQKVPIDALFEVASVKYAKINSFPVSATRALSYFEDAEKTPMPRMLKETNWAAVKKFLNRKAMEAGKKNLGNLWR